MAKRSRGHRVIPSASRMMRSLRDMGYEFPTAVADLVDNSIEARANRIDIDVEFEGDESWVRIADNGRGMSPDELREAMRYGSERDYDEHDLGKFGLGMKTASLSQCQRLSVGTRQSRKRARVTAYCWDLDHVQRTNQWEILSLEDEELAHAVRAPLKEHTGTVVLWERLDRILGYRTPYGESARKRMAGMTREVEQHVEMTFHRFLAGEARGRKVRMMINGNPVVPWDPFCRDEEHTEVLDSIELDVEHEDVSGSITLRPFIVPAQSQFSTAEAHKRAAGIEGWNDQQGFYIYRADRLVQSGGWCRLRKKDEHTKLARFALFFSPRLDEAFKINVAKMRVQLPRGVRDELQDLVAPIVKQARQTYDEASKSVIPGPFTPGKPHVPPEPPVDMPSPANSSNAGARAGTKSAEPWLSLKQFETGLLTVAKPEERLLAEDLLGRLRKKLCEEGEK